MNNGCGFSRTNKFTKQEKYEPISRNLVLELQNIKEIEKRNKFKVIYIEEIIDKGMIELKQTAQQKAENYLEIFDSKHLSTQNHL